MARRTVRTSRQRSALFSLPQRDADLLRHYTLSEEDLQNIGARRRPRNKLGFALQLCVLRYPGRLLAPACLDLARQIHAIPMKRGDEAMVESLNRDEVRILLDAPDPTTAAGVRDRAMLHLTYAAGLRVSELIGLMYTDLARPHLDTVRVTGKGRRERVLPLWQETRSALRDWLRVRPDTGQDHLFLNARGKAMTRHGFAHRLELHATTARQQMPSMTGKRIFPHLLRHSCAVHTLEATGDIRKVSLWLGHASIQSTEIYLRSDPIGKLDVLAARLPPAIRKGSFKEAPDRLLAILNDARAQ